MSMITLRQLLDHAAENGYAVPAFNINNMEQGLAVMAAAQATNSPVILQASRGARAYANDLVLKALIEVNRDFFTSRVAPLLGLQQGQPIQSALAGAVGQALKSATIGAGETPSSS